MFSARSVWYSYCVIQLGVLVAQKALIAPIYKKLSVSCSSFGSANATRYSTVLLFLCCGFYFHVVLCSPFFQCGDFGHLSSTCTKPTVFYFSSTPQLVIAHLSVSSHFGVVIFVPCCVLPDLAASFWSVL